ncbi:MAG: KH domain-containing protein [Solirubrobacterales bacterium]|nr:KH domain-containing protein [Solirubrobacterales bacterium]
MSANRDRVGERVREVMERIAAAADVGAEVELYDTEDALVAEYVGDDLGLLIGHHGQTIDAIQHLAYRIAVARTGERVAVVVDAAGYRERRATSLRQAADQAAQAAKDTRRPVPLEAMSAPERKVIHEHLKDRRDVETYSEGQEPSRHLVVAPLVA